MRPVSSRLFWRAAGIQTAITGVLFVVLALTVPHHFFKDWGIVVGPVIWIGCSLVTGRLLGLPLLFVLFCALAGGVAGTLVGLVAGHPVGIVAGVAVFAACCSGYGRGAPEERGPHDGRHTPDAARG
jgi:hypothetical protein